MGAVAFAGIVVLLYSEFRAWRHVLLVLLSFFFALIGGVLWCLARRWQFVTGFVDRFCHGGGDRRSQWDHDDQSLPSSGRCRKVWSLAGVGHSRRRRADSADPDDCPDRRLGRMPLIVAGNKPGHEIEFPMALVIVGGLLSSTLMNLFLMPSLYCLIGNAPQALVIDEELP